jgi:hypothetical protein
MPRNRRNHFEVPRLAVVGGLLLFAPEQVTMTERSRESQIAHPGGFGAHPVVGALVSFIDERLRRRHHVSEYTSRADCICRISFDRAGEQRILADGTGLRGDDRVVILHLWNERVTKMPADGPTLGWAQRFRRAFEASLRELESYLSAHRELDDVAAVRTLISIAAPRQRDRLSRLIERLGFEIIAMPEPSWPDRLRRLGENVLYAMMVYARNPAALRRDTFLRDRIVVYLPRRELKSRFGGDGAAPGKPNLPQPVAVVDGEANSFLSGRPFVERAEQ